MRKTSLVLLATLVVAAPLWADETINERRPLSSTGAVEIEMISGTVKVIGWDQSEVEITGRLNDVSEQLEIDVDHDAVSIEIMPSRGRHHNLPAEMIEVRMPRGARLELETISASIDVTELTGDVSTQLGQRRNPPGGGFTPRGGGNGERDHHPRGRRRFE